MGIYCISFMCTRANSLVLLPPHIWYLYENFTCIYNSTTLLAIVKLSQFILLTESCVLFNFIVCLDDILFTKMSSSAYFS